MRREIARRNALMRPCEKILQEVDGTQMPPEVRPKFCVTGRKDE